MERIPEIIARLDHLKQGQAETREFIKEEIVDLKSEHISDIRKNICRIWMRLDDLRDIQNRAAGAILMLRIYWTILGLVIGTLATLLTKHYI